MSQIDWSTLVNWLVTGFIGFMFGALGAFITYRLERRRDDIAWERDRRKQLELFAHEREILQTQFQQKLEEIKMQFQREDNIRTRQELLRGIDNPLEAIVVLHEAISEFTNSHSMRLADSQSREMNLLFELDKRLSEFLSK